MKQITFTQLLTKAATMGADTTLRADGVPAFMVEQYDAQPSDQQAIMLMGMMGESLVNYGDKVCALLSGSLNLNGADTQTFFVEAAPPVIPAITKRQFLIAAVMAGLVAAEDAESGAIPVTIAAVFDSLPTEQKVAARITWATMTVIERGEPLVAGAAAAFGMTESQIDNFFLQAATL